MRVKVAVEELLKEFLEELLKEFLEELLKEFQRTEKMSERRSFDSFEWNRI